MTEAEWITNTTSPLCMLAEYPAQWDTRKAFLAGDHCLSRVWNRLSENQKCCVETVRKVAEGKVKEAKLRQLLDAAYREYDSLSRRRNSQPYLDDNLATVHWLYDAISYFSPRPNCNALITIFRTLHVGEGKESQCELIREIFGNPFRPVAVNPAWRTSDVLALSQQMYESRDFGAMPILADALQDAGCDNVNVLDHCREPSEHVRGCWVIDLLLGK